MAQVYIKKLLIISTLIITGIALELTGLLEAGKLLNIAREYSDNWWLVIILILLQAALFSFALAGSIFLWVAAPLYPPLLSTFILAAGGTLGGIGAYFFSKKLTNEWIARVEKSHTYRLLQKNDNFFTLFAFRVFPAFPHSFINFSSGILKVKLSHFIAAAILGISIKSYIYSQVIYKATTSDSIGELLNISTYGPLILISVSTLTGVLIKYKMDKKHR